MNLHPLIVHFPIALLTLYSGLEVVRPMTKGPHWQHARAVLVIAGTIGAYFSLASGNIAASQYGAGAHDVLEMHERVAFLASWTYTVLAAAHLVRWAGQARLPAGVARVVAFVLDTPVAPVLAVAGFALLGLVGALGGILVYGQDFDPATKFVYGLFFRK